MIIPSPQKIHISGTTPPTEKANQSSESSQHNIGGGSGEGGSPNFLEKGQFFGTLECPKVAKLPKTY